MSSDMRLLVEVVVTLFAALISGLTTRYVTVDSFAEQIGKLNREAQSCSDSLNRTRSERDELSTKRDQLDAENRELAAKNDEIGQKYERCTAAEGKVVFLPSIDEEWHATTVSTGDGVRLKLSDSSIIIRLRRVTQDGPVFQVEGCNFPAVDAGVEMPNDGDSFYLVRAGEPLSVGVSTECCQQGLEVCSGNDLEEVVVRTQSYDVETQKAEIHYQKTFLGV